MLSDISQLGWRRVINRHDEYDQVVLHMNYRDYGCVRLTTLMRRYREPLA
jgi:hypothetical protein